MAGDAECVVDDFSLGEGLLVPALDQLGVIGELQWLDPCFLAGETFVDLEGESDRGAGLSESIEGFAMLAGRLIEIGSVDGVEFSFEQGGEFGAFDGASPIAKVADRALVQRASEVACAESDFEEVGGNVLGAQVFLLSNRLAIHREVDRSLAGAQDDSMRFAIADRRAVDCTDPADVIGEASAFDEERFGSLGPWAVWGAFGEDRAVASGLEGSRHGEILIGAEGLVV